MTTEEKIIALERLLRKCPDVLTSYGAAKWMHMSKNTVYALIREGKLTAYRYRGGFLISKADIIDYMAATTDDSPEWDGKFRGKGDE